MKIVMKDYEGDVQKPFTSLVFGEMAQRLLIQMQKIKVN